MSWCKRSPIVFILFLLLFSFYPQIQVSAESQKVMDVHFIDVGQGDSIFIITPSDKTILIDGGPPEAGKKVAAYLEERNIEKIDLLIATHPDIDHIGGLPHIMKSFKISQVLDSGKLYSTKTYGKYLNQIWKEDIPVKIARKNEQVKIDPLLDIKILNSYEKNKNNNQSSIVLKISYKEIDFLLMSDVEMEQEKVLLKRQDLQSEIIKVAHHGSNTSTSLGFLKEVAPQAAILTYSIENDYGHPVDRVIENLYKVNATIYSTANYGDVVIRTNGNNYYILPQRSPINNLKQEAG